MQKMVIELQGVKFTYPGASQPTLEIPELAIAKGERVFLYGPSGSGKTTLLEVLSGVLVPQEGKLLVAGTELQNLSPAQRDQFRAEKMGYVFQNFNLLPYLNVRDNIELPIRLRSRTELRPQNEVDLLRHLAERLGLTNLLEQSVLQLSVGQQQRVAVARALFGKPQILFADEPTSSLDYDNREKFLKLMFELSQEVGSTVLFVSHDRSLERLFDRSLSFLQINKASQGVQP